MNRFLLYGHGGSYNHGAEAILKCTIRKLREQHKDVYIVLSSNFPEQDKQFGVDADEIIGPNLDAWEEEKTAPRHAKEGLARKMYADAMAHITQDTTLLSIGGDNYCYPTWHRLAVFQKEAVRKGAKSILWSASVEPSAITQEMTDILNTYDKITARESLTYEALKTARIKAELELNKDVAFSLESEAIDLPVGFEKDSFVGINFGPLIMRAESVPGIVMENFQTLVASVLETTKYSIALIPHVVMPMDNDHLALSDLYRLLPSSLKHRVWLVNNEFSAAQYKYIISNCKAIAASRTHAAIAAYSTNVPCLAIGYSVKAVGIANDLGKSDFVLNISEICNKNDIASRFYNVLDL
jgi:polysaccharide pyruvyl transferase WcaK-like protein